MALCQRSALCYRYAVSVYILLRCIILLCCHHFCPTRCDCYGHGLDCTFDDALQPNPSYKCHCELRTFTQGDQVSAKPIFFVLRV